MFALSPPAGPDKDDKLESIWPYYAVALSIGVALLSASYFVPDTLRTVRDLVRELGVVLISVWGVSLSYEKFLAARHFRKFHANLTDLIRRGEMNAAVCEGLGILEIFRTRRAFEEKHSLSAETMSVTSGDLVRLTGRSLIFTMYGWQNLRHIVESGASLQMCLSDPAIRESPLNYLSAYSAEETNLAIQRFLYTMKPWLGTAKPRGIVELRFHPVHLLDSLMQIKMQSQHRIAWDLNFGEGIEERQVFYLNGDAPLGRNLTSGRYQLIWDKSTPVFRYQNGQIELDQLSTATPAGPPN